MSFKDISNNLGAELLRSGLHSLDLSGGIVQPILGAEAVDVILDSLIRRISAGCLDVRRTNELTTPTYSDACFFYEFLQSTKNCSYPEFVNPGWPA